MKKKVVVTCPVGGCYQVYSNLPIAIASQRLLEVDVVTKQDEANQGNGKVEIQDWIGKLLGNEPKHILMWVPFVPVVPVFLALIDFLIGTRRRHPKFISKSTIRGLKTKCLTCLGVLVGPCPGTNLH